MESDQSNSLKMKKVLSSPTAKSQAGIRRIFRTLGRNLFNEIRYASQGIRSTDLWQDDRDFYQIFPAIKDRTMLSPQKLYSLYQLAGSAALVDGNVAELGVYKGGSARLLYEVFNRDAADKNIMLFDTFEGMTSIEYSHDFHKRGDFDDTSIEGVKKFLAGGGNVSFYKGLFSETLPSLAEGTYCFVHIDADLYSSILECCQYFYPRLSAGGILVFDDYGFISCPGAKKAVDEFFTDKPEKPVYLFTGQCLIIKR